jgi:PAS domain S-box-containing protein
VLTSCSDDRNSERPLFVSFKDIPGITIEEIQQIENLQQKYDYFNYGMLPSTETFINAAGELDGFTVLLCDWLTELFDIPFVPQHYSWVGLLSGLESSEISFTGELTPNPERHKVYIMTDHIAHRMLKKFHLKREVDDFEGSHHRVPRFMLQRDTTIHTNVMQYYRGDFEPILFSEYREVYEALKSGEADAMITESVQEYFFSEHSDMRVSPFFPLIYSPVSLTTQNPELEPIISVVQKALTHNASRFLHDLYDTGYERYQKYKLHQMLTEEEREYIRNTPVVYIGGEFDNYPVSYFDTHDEKWAGIAFDVLDEISHLTGLTFIVKNDTDTNFSTLMEMLKSNEIQMITEMIQTPDREGLFIWPENSFMIERSVLISRVEHRNINVNRVYSEKIGLSLCSAHTEYFNRWFLNHPNITMYNTQTQAFDALRIGEVDMVLNSFRKLLYMTNYLEIPGFKGNILFDNYFASTYGLNIDEIFLRNIVDKALGMIDTELISEQWRNKTYDYRLKLVQAQKPWLIGTIVSTSIVLILVIFLFFRSHISSKLLSKRVKEQTAELALQTATLTTLFDSIPNLIFTKNHKLQFMHANKAFLLHFDKKLEEVIGKTDAEALDIPVDIVQWYNKVDMDVILTGKTVSVEEQIPRHDGTNPLYETIRMPLLLNGTSLGIMGIANDITKLKESEKAIVNRYNYAKKMNDALASITESHAIAIGSIKETADQIAEIGCLTLNTSRLGVWLYCPETNTLSCVSYYNSDDQSFSIPNNYELSSNPEYEKLLNTERLIIMSNRGMCSLILDNETDYDYLSAALDAPIKVDGKFAGVVCVEQSSCDSYPVARNWQIEEQNFASSLADLMALTITSSERRVARENAETASKSKSTFLANMSHEIRTPMNAILGTTEFMLDSEVLPTSIEKGLYVIYNSCNLLLGIINDILDFSKIEAGKMDIKPTNYKLTSLINDTIKFNVMKIANKPIVFKLEIDENTPANLIGDEIRIKQILNNLLTNAFKYTDSGQVVLTVSFERLSDDKVSLNFCISDTGHGMSEEQLGILFEEYSRFSTDKNKTIEGTGLGLTITRKLLHLMHGDIKVVSQVDVGSVFTIHIPQTVSDNEVLGIENAQNLKNYEADLIKPRLKAKIVRTQMPFGNVLIVDDVETNLFVAKSLLKLYKLKIETALTGAEAIHKIEKGNDYDVIFMDHMMPGMDGIETTKRIREMGYTNPIVVLTANVITGQSDMFLNNGFDNFLSKPIDIRQMDTILNKYIRDKYLKPEDLVETEESDDKTSLLSILIPPFITDAENTIAIITPIIEDDLFDEEESIKSFTIIVHGIKSSLHNIGEGELSEQALQLETAARNQNLGYLKQNAPDFLGSLTVVLDKFKKLNEGISDDTEDIDSLIADLGDIIAFCEDMDRKSTMDIIKSIQNKSSATAELLININNKVLHSEFDEAIEMAQDYLEHLQTANKYKNEVSDIYANLFKKNIIEGLDINSGLQKFNNDEKVYIRILRSYSICIREMLDFDAEINEENVSTYKIVVHGVKGASLDIYSMQIGELARQLEMAAAAADVFYITDQHPVLVEMIHKFLNQLAKLLNAVDTAFPKPLKDRPDAELFKKLVIAAKKYDINTVDGVMSELENFRYENDNDVVDWLRDQVDQMNFSEIVEKLESRT